VWKFTEEDELSMSVALPVDDPAMHRRQPWLLHILHVNTLNFCSFAYCKAQGRPELAETDTLTKLGDVGELLIAVPNTITSENVSANVLLAVLRLIGGRLIFFIYRPRNALIQYVATHP
jgi:ASTRA-associated protein 1